MDPLWPLLKRSYARESQDVDSVAAAPASCAEGEDADQAKIPQRNQYKHIRQSPEGGNGGQFLLQTLSRQVLGIELC